MSFDFEDIFLKTHVAHTLEVLDDAHTTFKSEHVFVLKARGRCRFFARSFYWSGGELVEQPELECDYDQWGHPLHKIHGPIIRDNNLQTVLVDLGKYYEEGEQLMVHMRQNLRDLEGTFEPFLGSSIRIGGFESVSLTVVLPSTITNKVTYSIEDLRSGHVESTELLKPISGTSTSFKFQKNQDLDPKTVNKRLRIRWSK